MPAKAALRGNAVSAETKTPTKSPPHSEFLEDFRNRVRSRKCVVGPRGLELPARALWQRGAIDHEMLVAAATASLTHRFDRTSQNTTCQSGLSHYVVLFGRFKGHLTEQVFNAFHIDGILD